MSRLHVRDRAVIQMEERGLMVDDIRSDATNGEDIESRPLEDAHNVRARRDNLVVPNVTSQPRRRWRFYRTASGAVPVRDFLTSSTLSPDDRDEVLAAMKDVQVNGLEVARHLRGDIFEVRASGARASYRVLFATEGARSQVLLAVSAFSKKTQKTPPSEITLAERRLGDWRRRGRRSR